MDQYYENQCRTWVTQILFTFVVPVFVLCWSLSKNGNSFFRIKLSCCLQTKTKIPRQNQTFCSTWEDMYLLLPQSAGPLYFLWWPFRSRRSEKPGCQACSPATIKLACPSVLQTETNSLTVFMGVAKVSRYTSIFARPLFLPPPFATPPHFLYIIIIGTVFIIIV